MIGFGKFGQFGQFGSKRGMEISSLSDERLMLVDPTVPGFFDKVLNYGFTSDSKIRSYINAVKRVKEENLVPFWRPIMDPGVVGKEIYYTTWQGFMDNQSYDYWENRVAEMQPVEGNVWNIGSVYQYYADQVDIINKYVDAGYKLSKVLEGVVHNLEILDPDPYDYELEFYYKICGRKNLDNCGKILRCTNRRSTNKFCIAGGPDNSIAELRFSTNIDIKLMDCVVWLVLYAPRTVNNC